MKEFGLTPEQVDNMTAEDVEIYSELLKSYYEAQAREVKNARRGIPNYW